MTNQEIIERLSALSKEIMSSEDKTAGQVYTAASLGNINLSISKNLEEPMANAIMNSFMIPLRDAHRINKASQN